MLGQKAIRTLQPVTEHRRQIQETLPTTAGPKVITGDQGLGATIVTTIRCPRVERHVGLRAARPGAGRDATSTETSA